MAYFLTRWVIGPHPSIDLSDEDFAALAKARDQLGVTLGLEEKFDLLLSNYADFEEDLLRLSLRHMIRSDVDWSGMVGDRMQLTRRLANLLSTARLYSDQVNHDLSQYYGSEASAAFKADLSREYDSVLGFRVLEALRNYMQHRNIPVSGISYPFAWRGEDPNRWLRFGLYLNLDIDLLVSDSGFKAAIANELAAAPPENVDLVLFVRQYVEGLARVHDALRARIKAEVIAADALYREIIRRWADRGEPNSVGLAVVERKTEAQPPERLFHVSLNVVERRDELATRNQMLDKLSRRFVSGATKTSGF